jgi:imidazolonepropionase-like amidohydrolase
MSKTLITNARIIDSSGRDPFSGQVVIAGNRIETVDERQDVSPDPDWKIIDAGGRTLMPGLIEAHAHLSFTNMRDLMELVRLPVEEHLLITLKHAQLMLEQGFTSLFSAAAANPRLDVVVRNAINKGDFPGPRLLAATREMTPTGNLGDLDQSHLPIPEASRFAVICDGPVEFRKACRVAAREGVDTFKVNASGDRGWKHMGAGDETTVMTDDEMAEVTGVARARGKRVAAHATSAGSVKLCLRHGVDMIYHAAHIDAEAIDQLEAVKDRIFVGPTIGLPYVLRFEAQDHGIDIGDAARRGLDIELEKASRSMAELHRRGVRVLPGGDYGVGCNKIGTNARDLVHFVELFGFSPMDTLVAATRYGGELMGKGDELGQIRAGFLADLLVVDGDPLADLGRLQRQDNLRLIMKDGQVYKNTLAV